jgi:hypothetical protein
MKTYPIIFTLIIGIFTSLSYADVLIINRIQQEQSLDMPKRGMTMIQVINQYGEPITKNSPIGTPPITEWQYDNFSVYFESKWVINSVAYKASANELGPKYIK